MLKKKDYLLLKNVKKQSQIQCFLKEKLMIYLERQNRKNEKMKNGNRKIQKLKKN